MDPSLSAMPPFFPYVSVPDTAISPTACMLRLLKLSSDLASLPGEPPVTFLEDIIGGFSLPLSLSLTFGRLSL